MAHYYVRYFGAIGGGGCANTGCTGKETRRAAFSEFAGEDLDEDVGYEEIDFLCGGGTGSSCSPPSSVSKNIVSALAGDGDPGISPSRSSCMGGSWGATSTRSLEGVSRPVRAETGIGDPGISSPSRPSCMGGSCGGASARSLEGVARPVRAEGCMLLAGRGGSRGVKSCGEEEDSEVPFGLGVLGGTVVIWVRFEPYESGGMGSPAGVGGSGGE